MKKLTTAALVFALLLAAAGCKGNDTPAETTGTTAPETTEATTETTTDTITTSVGEGSTPPETTETEETTVTTEAPVDIDTLLEGLTVHSLASTELEDFRNGFAEDTVLGTFAVEITDRPGMYLIIEDEGVEGDGGSYERASVKRVICDGVVQDCDLPFVFGPSGFDLLYTDEYTVVGRYWYESYYYLFCEGEWLYVPAGSGRDGASPQMYIEDGALKYTAANPKYARAQTYFEILDVVDDLNDWSEERGSVFVRDGEVCFEAEEERLLDSSYIELFEKLKGNVVEDSDGDVYDFSRFETIEELLEYNFLKAHPDEFLKTMPVYEISYEEDRSLDAFDRYGAAEYEKYAAGEEFNEFFALRLREYPDIYLIGEVVTEPGIENDYHQRYLHGVIRNGKMHVVTGDFYGPGFHIDITEDFVCISGRAGSIGEMLYFHDYGVEQFLSSDIGDWGHTVQLYEKDGTMRYVFFTNQYARQSLGLHLGYNSPDDRFYDSGTVQLVDGRIQYIPDVSYTIGTWYDTQTEFKERSGCSNVDDFMKWYKEKYDANDWDELSVPLP